MFSIFFFRKMFLKILKNECNAANLRYYVFVIRLYITHNNFSSYRTCSCAVISSTFFLNAIFINEKFFFKIYMKTQISINSFKIRRG